MTDAHCHPFDLCEQFPGGVELMEADRRKRGVLCAANSWNKEQFKFHENLSQMAKAANAPLLIPCFAVHPQLCADKKLFAELKDDLFFLLEKMAGEGRLGAVGETGFDFYGERFKETEKIQDEVFFLHLETAVKYGLPLIIHVRRAMHKIFPFTKEFKKLPALIFHSWPGTFIEGDSLIRRGINVYFSFGANIVNNHREARLSCTKFPAERILFETDAPYQPVKGKSFSSWEDLPAIIREAANLRKEAGSSGGTYEELEKMTDINFRRAFGIGPEREKQETK